MYLITRQSLMDYYNESSLYGYHALCVALFVFAQLGVMPKLRYDYFWDCLEVEWPA